MVFVLISTIWRNFMQWLWIFSEQNEATYHQTEGGSQLLTPECIELLGRYSEGPQAIDVLAGNMDFSTSFDEYTIDFLNACKRLPDPHNSGSFTVNRVSRYHSLKKSCSKRRESTHTYNFHAGHCKVVVRDPFLNWLFFN